jgi:hypothetical protein
MERRVKGDVGNKTAVVAESKANRPFWIGKRLFARAHLQHAVSGHIVYLIKDGHPGLPAVGANIFSQKNALL